MIYYWEKIQEKRNYLKIRIICFNACARKQYNLKLKHEYYLKNED